MSDFSIGLGGIDAARNAMDIIGNNIANAGTDGYHRQRIEFSPAPMSLNGTTLMGGGVDIKGIIRTIDNFLEREILNQQSASEQVSQEAAVLKTIETAFGEFYSEEGGLNAAIDKFFNSLQDLSANPADAIWQNQVVSDAQAMADRFRTLGEFLNSLENQIRLEAENTVDTINTLVRQIADLNGQIERLVIAGQQANSLCDQRDQFIAELSGLIGVVTNAQQDGMVNISAGGLPLVVGAFVNELEISFDANGNIGVTIGGSSTVTTDVQGGKTGGLISLYNEIVSGIHDDLDSLANAIIQQVNRCHVQGVGSEGSFASLTGWANAGEDLADFTNVTVGSIFVRVTNTVTGVTTRTEIAVNPAADSLSDIAAAITAVTGINASVNASNQLTILAEANYKFDFLPAVGSSPLNSTLTGSPPAISFSGIYTGTANDTFTFTVSGTGAVGNGTLQLVIRDGDGNEIDTLNVGAGYAAGDEIEIGETGIKISLGTGNLNNTETFEADVFGCTDTSGLLAAAGINTFFAGSGAANMAVCDDIINNPRRTAVALGADMDDNANALRMADIRNQAVTSLNSLTCGEFYRRLVTDIGQQVSVKQIRQENIDAILLNLSNRRNEASGVDINEEAAQLLIFEQMYQASAKYIHTINSSLSTLMELL